MKITPSLKSNNINFQKTLSAKCSLKAKDKGVRCSIYNLCDSDDRWYFKKLMHNESWKNAHYLEAIDCDINDEALREDIFVLEDEENNCLGFSEFKKYKNKIWLIFMESRPQDAFSSCLRNIKYIGETMLAFVVSCAKKEGFDMVVVPMYTSDSKGFYEKCQFKIDSEKEEGLAIKKDSYDKLLSQNQVHINSKEGF